MNVVLLDKYFSMHDAFMKFFFVVASTTQNNVLWQYLKQAQHDDYSDFALSCQGSTCSSD